MTPAWAQRQEALLSDCVVFPDVFDHMVDGLRDFVVPYQHALETGSRTSGLRINIGNLSCAVREGSISGPPH